MRPPTMLGKAVRKTLSPRPRNKVCPPGVRPLKPLPVPHLLLVPTPMLCLLLPQKLKPLPNQLKVKPPQRVKQLPNLRKVRRLLAEAEPQPLQAILRLLKQVKHFSRANWGATAAMAHKVGAAWDQP